MSVEISLNGKIMTAILDGEIDHHSAKDIREKIDSAINKKQPSILNLDFSKIQFMDSSGIGLIMGRYKAMSLLGGHLKVINTPKNIVKIIKLSGLGSLGVIEEGDQKQYETNK